MVERGLDRFDASLFGYCLMGNHYHFVVQTRQSNLSRLMRHINGVYTQRYHRRYRKVGHLFRGRFKAIVVDRDGYLLEVSRYVDLNPLRANMVKHPRDWPWSSYRAHTGAKEAPTWLDSGALAPPVVAACAAPRWAGALCRVCCAGQRGGVVGVCAARANRSGR